MKYSIGDDYDPDNIVATSYAMDVMSSREEAVGYFAGTISALRGKVERGEKPVPFTSAKGVSGSYKWFYPVDRDSALHGQVSSDDYSNEVDRFMSKFGERKDSMKEYKVGDTFSISLEQLWKSTKLRVSDSGEKELQYTQLRRSREDGTSYYDLAGTISACAIMDGEECKVVSVEKDKVGIVADSSSYGEEDIAYLTPAELDKSTYSSMRESSAATFRQQLDSLGSGALASWAGNEYKSIDKLKNALYTSKYIDNPYPMSVESFYNKVDYIAYKLGFKFDTDDFSGVRTPVREECQTSGAFAGQTPERMVGKRTFFSKKPDQYAESFRK